MRAYLSIRARKLIRTNHKYFNRLSVMVIQINHQDFFEWLHNEASFFPPAIKSFAFSDIHEKVLQKIIEEEVLYFYETVLEQEAPSQILVFIRLMRSNTIMSIDTEQSDTGHIYLFVNGMFVIQFLNNRKEMENDFRYGLLHELVHAADLTAIKNAFSDVETVEADRDPKFSYTLLVWPLNLLRLYRNEGVAVLCACLFARFPSELFKTEVSGTIKEMNIYHHFGEYFSDLGKYHLSLSSKTKKFDEIADMVYASADKILLDVLKNLDLIPKTTTLKELLDKNSKDEKTKLFKICTSLSLSQYVAGLMVVDWEGMGMLPVLTVLKMCADVQRKWDSDKMSLYTLLVETPFPSATDFIEVLDELGTDQLPDESVDEKIKLLRDNPSGMDAGTVDLIGRIWDFYKQNQENNLYQTYATAARRVLDYYFYRDDLIQDNMVGIGYADDILLMNKMWNLLQYEVFTPYLKFEMNEAGTGLVITRFSRWAVDEEGDYLEPLTEIAGNALYIPAYHEYEGKLYPVVGIMDGSRLGDHQIHSLYLPKTVAYIGKDRAFVPWFRSLKSIIVDSGNPYYDSRQRCNAIIETATNKLIFSCANTFIPYSVTAIGPRALENAKGLCEDGDENYGTYYLVVPDSVTEIDDNAFRDCMVNKIYISDPTLIKYCSWRTRVVKI